MRIQPSAKFLGEQAVDTASHPVFARYQRADWALLLVQENAGIDGAAHKAWVLDQVARVLHGTRVIVTLAGWSNGHTEHRFKLGEPSNAYVRWRETLVADGALNYDEGLPP